MIARKLKICSCCEKEAYLFSKGQCGTCWAKNYKKPIKKVSANQKEILDLYAIVSKKFKERNPLCQPKLKGCTGITTQTHHRIGKNSKDNWLNDEYFMAVCAACHRTIEDMGEEVYELGFKIKRI